MLDEVDIELRKEAWRRGRMVLVILVVGFIGLGAFCWVNRDSMWRGVLSRTKSDDELAWGAGCLAFDNPYIPELVAAVKDQFPDRDSVRAVETFHFPPDAPTRKLQVQAFGADKATVAIEMKFAARGKSGVMQFFSASAALNPQTCAVSLYTITDDNGHTDFIQEPKMPAGT